MRSAAGVSRVSRILVVLGFLSLLIPATATASGTQRGAAAARQARNKKAAQAKKSKEKLAVQRTKQGQEQKKGAKAAGVLPRPGAKKAPSTGAGKLAGTRTASVSKTTPRARTTAKRPVRKTPVTRKTRRPTAAKRRSARTNRTRSRRSPQELAAGEAPEMAAGEGPDGMGPDGMGPGGQMGDVDFESGPPKSRFRRFMSAAGRGIKAFGKYGLVIAAPAVVLAAGFTLVGGATVMGIGFAIAAPAIMLGIPMVIGLREQAARQAMGGDDIQQDQLQRYMTRQMLENQDLNGPGPGNGVAGVGGLNTIGNMINPGGIGGQQMP